MVNDGSGTPQADTIGDILGINAADLVNVAEQSSTVTGSLAVAASQTQ